MLRTIALTGIAALVAATSISLAPPAHAQIGNIFSDPPLRPPGAIPRGNQQREQQFPDDDEEVPDEHGDDGGSEQTARRSETHSKPP